HLGISGSHGSAGRKPSGRPGGGRLLAPIVPESTRECNSRSVLSASPAHATTRQARIGRSPRREPGLLSLLGTLKSLPWCPAEVQAARTPSSTSRIPRVRDRDIHCPEPRRSIEAHRSTVRCALRARRLARALLSSSLTGRRRGQQPVP